MDLNTFLTAAGIVIASVVAYLIARREGVAGSVKARLVLGFANRDEPLNEYWAACVVVPDLQVSHYIVTIPFTVRNDDRPPLRSVRLQVAHARELSMLAGPDIRKGLIEQTSTSSIARSDAILGNHAVSDYEIPVVRREEDLLVGHPLLIPAHLLTGSSDKMWIGELEYQLTAENTTKQNHTSYLAIALCAEREITDDEGEKLTSILSARSKRDRPPKAVLVWKWRAPDKPLEVRRCLMIQPFWTKALSRTVAVEEALMRGRATHYVESRMDVVILPGVLPRSRRDR